MPERRYSYYKQEDVWSQMLQYQEKLGIQVVANTVVGNSVTIRRTRDGKDKKCNIEYRAVILARSSDWYVFSLNCIDRYLHGIICAIVGTHDSCIDRPVLAMDVMRWYEPLKMRADFGELQPTFDAENKPIRDQFDEARKTQYGSNMLLGALMQRRPDAFARLDTLPKRTRKRYEQKMMKLARRRVGHPFVVWPVGTSIEDFRKNQQN